MNPAGLQSQSYMCSKSIHVLIFYVKCNRLFVMQSSCNFEVNKVVFNVNPTGQLDKPFGAIHLRTLMPKSRRGISSLRGWRRPGTVQHKPEYFTDKATRAIVSMPLVCLGALEMFQFKFTSRCPIPHVRKICVALYKNEVQYWLYSSRTLPRGEFN